MIEPSEAPTNALGDTGDLLDRMRGNSGTRRNNADAFPDLKKMGSLSSESQNPLKKNLVDKSAFPSKAQAKKLDDPDETEDAEEDANEEAMEESNPADGTEGPKKKRARKKWKKPKDKPNRPLSAYNLFFQAERASMLGDDAMAHDQDKAKKRVHRKTHGKVGFAEMARVIGQKWKQLPEDKRAPFMEKAAKEKTRYATELQAWKDLQKLKVKASKLKAKNQSWGMEGSSSHTDDDGGLRRMMQDGAARHQLSLLQAQQADNDYIRALQERQLAILTGRSNLDSNAFQYPSAAEASANAILQQFQNSMGGGSGGLSRSGFSGSGLTGLNAMNVNSGFAGMGINSMNMNSMNQVGMNMMDMMDLQPMGNMARQSALGASENRLQQLRASAGLSDMSLGQTTGMGMGSTNNSSAGGFGTQQGGDLGRIQQFSQQFPGNEMAAAMARRYQNRF
eukprot:Nitzschia sp. Nitz4//scaffold39_size137210//32887//34236//NITZ4_003192-RA/size137210-processed-gene-0.31-mRNA-1//1//CDS//3329550362//1647//frame0